MLGKLARYLRIMGYDTEYLHDDDELIKKSLEEKRILVTRDKVLYLKASKLNIKSILIRSSDVLNQLREIVSSNIRIKKGRPRCPLCNTKLKDVDKNRVKHLVPEKVYTHNKIFMLCENCNKIYWYGKHWIGIEKVLRDIGI